MNKPLKGVHCSRAPARGCAYPTRATASAHPTRAGTSAHPTRATARDVVSPGDRAPLLYTKRLITPVYSRGGAYPALERRP
ncbi:MAG: hypothetical protein ACJ8AG_00790 [Ktedonobacteraceae bacterium]